MSYISATLRRLVTQRAGEQCEYCRFPQTASLFAFEIEHIIAEKHDGITEAENLALSCPCCNRFKGTDLGSIDPETQQLTPFFNPRLQRWSDHYTSGKSVLVGRWEKDQKFPFSFSPNSEHHPFLCWRHHYLLG